MLNRFLLIVAAVCVVMLYAGMQSSKLRDKFLGSEVDDKLLVTAQNLPEGPFIKRDFKTEFFLGRGNSAQLQMVHFWASWCAPCEREFPELMEFVEKFSKESIHLYLIVVQDERKNVEKFLKKYFKESKNITVLYDSKNYSKTQFGTYRLPETYIYDHQGQFTRKWSGNQNWMSNEITQYFQDLISSTPKNT